ncbi:hypothetical protein F3Y22_tig00112523pilonHSYRG00069 [Hibiscus syriacus]|uniref:Uncharacterized protein n=1 Tax=Hibiscus syriacus TaxID=106335 RepID=A0A6A2Y5R6_HIBSY|nr:hypothetical protein F3Y22_tig00112523pilonHSYRG00069 [Hibiscus syriacus]
MAPFHVNRRRLAMVAWAMLLVLVMMTNVGIAERTLKEKEKTKGLLLRVVSFLWQGGKSAYEPVWPLWAALEVLAVAVFLVPMLTLIIGFDPKSSTAISKCMIMGAAGSTVYYNLRLRHPTLEMPLIDYDLALLFQPMLMLGISIGVTLNILFADWMVTLLLIILFISTSTKALIKGLDTWTKETVVKKEAARLEAEESKLSDGAVQDHKMLPSGPSAIPHDDDDASFKNISGSSDTKHTLERVIAARLCVDRFSRRSDYQGISSNLLSHVLDCEPPAVFEAKCLYKGRRVIASKGKEVTNWKIYQILLYCSCGIIAGLVGGLLGLGGGFILGPLFLELGIPPQKSLVRIKRDTPADGRSSRNRYALDINLHGASFIPETGKCVADCVTCSKCNIHVFHGVFVRRFGRTILSSPYAAYFVLVATIAAITGLHVVRKIITVFGRASIIIFVLALTIFISAISLGGVGIADMVEKLEDEEYMGFENLCNIS